MEENIYPVPFTRYLKYLLVPLIGSCIIGFVVGILRYYQGFLVGIQGMVMALLIGGIFYYSFTPLAPTLRSWGFSQRNNLALILVALFLVGHYSGLAVSLNHDNCQHFPWVFPSSSPASPFWSEIPSAPASIHEQPRDLCTPQTVLLGILEDWGYEHVYGSSRTRSYHFRMGGIAWVLFNLLDIVFQWFMTLLMVGIAVDQKPKKTER